MKLTTTDQAHRTGTCNEQTCPSCETWRTIEADLRETEVAGTTWLLAGTSLLGAVTLEREGDGFELTVGRSTRWLSDAEFADLGAFITRCQEA